MSAESNRTASLTMPSDRELVVTREFDAPRELVYEAWTSPAHLPNWMTGPDGWTMPVCEIDPRPGGTWRFVWRGADGAEMEMTGEYREIVPPERVVTIERWGGPWPETTNTMVFAEENGRTTLALTILYPSKEARDEALGTGMAQGMNISFARCDAYLSTLA